MVESTQLTWHKVGGAPRLYTGGRSPGLVVRQEAEGDGGGLLANTGLNRVRTHLKGPAAVLLVLVGHSEGAR